eukprot:COSAG05_NODE_513_length_9084_cov_5.373957_10_plen_167_part_00
MSAQSWHNHGTIMAQSCMAQSWHNHAWHNHAWHNHGTIMAQSCMAQSWHNHGTIMAQSCMAQSWHNHGTIMHGTIMAQSWHNHGSHFSSMTISTSMNDESNRDSTDASYLRARACVCNRETVHAERGMCGCRPPRPAAVRSPARRTCGHGIDDSSGKDNVKASTML